MFIFILARGKATSGSSGIITAIADQASKLHPNSNSPVVILESADTYEILFAFIKNLSFNYTVLGPSR